MNAQVSSKPTFRGQPVDAVIDVRSKLEFWMGHIDGATCIPVDVIGSHLPMRSDIAKNAKILLYCASGARSAAATAELRALGYKNVIDGGGISTAAAKYTA